MTRKTFLVTLASSAFLPLLRAQSSQSAPWSKDDLIEPADLAKILTGPGNSPKPTIICVAFPFLYRQRHIVNARFAGPTSKPEGIAALKNAVAELSKNTEIVIYCGCCPMVRCPNIRPAYQALKELGYTNVRVLDLPTNFHTDWTARGYPVEPPVSHAS